MLARKEKHIRKRERVYESTSCVCVRAKIHSDMYVATRLQNFVFDPLRGPAGKDYGQQCLCLSTYCLRHRKQNRVLLYVEAMRSRARDRPARDVRRAHFQTTDIGSERGRRESPS